MKKAPEGAFFVSISQLRRLDFGLFSRCALREAVVPREGEERRAGPTGTAQAGQRCLAMVSDRVRLMSAKCTSRRVPSLW